jgi:hypothetical protein
MTRLEPILSKTADLCKLSPDTCSSKAATRPARKTAFEFLDFPRRIFLEIEKVWSLSGRLP